MLLSHLQIARAHWLLGALFLALILEEYLPRSRRDGRPERSRSTLVPWALILGGVGAWTTTVFADVVHDMLIHFLWGDILFVAGSLELARRRGVYDRPWLDVVLPLAFLGNGAVFIVHERIDPTALGENWHLAMGLLLIAAGVLELVRVRLRPALRLSPAIFPLAAFALVLIAIPVGAAS
ncbi:MAG TPA: hypothetical protein VG295_01980 [Solirubrobacteraceae bacterium]|nr:hypothetical protein [Solirubrobacteraceae bacterium]